MTEFEQELLQAIVQRAESLALGEEWDTAVRTQLFDLLAEIHTRTPLALSALLGAARADFARDVFGMRFYATDNGFLDGFSPGYVV